MTNVYKNAFADLTTTNATIYTTPSDSRAIIQNIQVANDTLNNTNVEIYVHDSSASTTYHIAHDQLSTKETVNMAKGPVILEESDYIIAEASANSTAHLSLAILEISRNEQ